VHWIHRAAVHPYCDHVTSFVIVCNTVALALEHYNMNRQWGLALAVANNIFTLIFVAEALMKWIGMVERSCCRGTAARPAPLHDATVHSISRRLAPPGHVAVLVHSSLALALSLDSRLQCLAHSRRCACVTRAVCCVQPRALATSSPPHRNYSTSSS
jgi:hypothetical protein